MLGSSLGEAELSLYKAYRLRLLDDLRLHHRSRRRLDDHLSCLSGKASLTALGGGKPQFW